MGTASESGSEVFPVAYYDKEAFLRQDPQLHRQLTIAGGFERIYDIGPCWRAEASHTTRHLCEHRVCAAEMAFIQGEQDVMHLEEELIVSALKRVKKLCDEELKQVNIEINIPSTPFPELRFPEIYDILNSHGKMLKFPEDIDTEADRILWQHVKDKHDAEFYFFNKFPFALKPFYVMEDDNAPGFAKSVDLNFRGLELSSGGQRENRYEALMRNVKAKKMNEASVEWFTKFFKYGVPPHGGFAIGVERLTQSLLRMDNIKECVLFPRDPDRLVP
jgi:aspartyl-tRNA synthetase